MDRDQRRRLAAKRNNERMKLISAFMNNLAVGVLAGAVIVPAANTQVPGAQLHWIWIPAAVVLHMGALTVLQFLKSED